MAGSADPGRKILGILPADAGPGALLVLCALAAILVVNSPLGHLHEQALKTVITVGPEGAAIAMKGSDWVKNALMAVFFFFVGLELKKELLEGQLSDPRAAILPAMGAVGGMAAPALIFLAIAGPAGYSDGWAIPAATDIAFALGVLSLLGSRVPASLKAFLLAVAVVDDLGAILIVAFAYTDTIRMDQLAGAGAMMAVLVLLNRMKVSRVGVFIAAGLPLWVFLQNSGINPTIGGVLVAACVPLKDRLGGSPLHRAEDDFRPWVHYLIMPVFAFANAGVNFTGGAEAALHPVSLGAALGLLLGKPIGITAMTLVTALVLKAPKPGTLVQVIGVSCIAGIGFTMSLFIGALAFDDPALAAPVRIGVYAGSVLSALLGLFILARSLPKVVACLPQDDPTHPFICPEVPAPADGAAAGRTEDAQRA
jgi:Na+:H+ antiporter, NhaA family